MFLGTLHEFLHHKALTRLFHKCDEDSTQTFNMKALQDMHCFQKSPRKLTHWPLEQEAQGPSWGAGRWARAGGVRAPLSTVM